MKISVSLGNLFQHLITLRAEKFSCDDTEFPCCSFGRCTSCAPSLSNQPLGCTSSPLAFSSSGKKKASQIFQLQSSPSNTWFFSAELIQVCQPLYCTAKAGHSHGHHSPSVLTEQGELCYRTKNLKHRKSQVFLTLLYLTAGVLKMNLFPTPYSLTGYKVGNHFQFYWMFPCGDQHHKCGVFIIHKFSK